MGIDSIVYGVEDMEICHRFFSDWGLETVRRTASEVVLKTRQGPSAILRNLNTQVFPFPGPQPGSGLREVVWGVRSLRDLDSIDKALSRHYPVIRSSDGAVHSIDPFGYGVGFTLWRHQSAESPHGGGSNATRMNFVGARNRISEPSTHYVSAEPTRIGHVVFEVAGPDDLRAGEAFYVGCLKFLVSDRYTDKGLFCRCAEESDHHNVALLTTRNQRTQFEHAAFEVRDIHEVFGGGLHFAERGWETAIGPGRHKVSSAYFWYFNSPCGGQVEYFSDTDFLDKNWKARNIAPGPSTIAEWALFEGVPRFKGFPER
ncbi:MAG TPA: VOC family protein [Burkholderiales bacterium]|jgi:catechol-2,3-dioxygenase|nr:VOC family protein [Burkholderiales bacterium]